MRFVLQFVFLLIFMATAVATLLGVFHIPPFENFEEFFLKTLFSALLIEVVAIVIMAGRHAFADGHIEHYEWQIIYPPDLEKRFTDPFASDREFMEFVERNKYKLLSQIEAENEGKDGLKDTLDAIFVLRKAGEFAGNRADGELFLERRGGSHSSGKAVLLFPGETQPIAFDVTPEETRRKRLRLNFKQPTRFVDWQGRINTWKGADLGVTFEKENGTWSGALDYNGIDVGNFTLRKK